MPLPPLVAPVPALSDAERRRTARHARLTRLGDVGQRRLAAAHVAIVGAGGLGSPVILALAAAGVGTLTVIDDDDVEVSNLQRQVIHSHATVGRPKVDGAEAAARGLFPDVRFIPRPVRLDDANAASLLRDADLVIDGSDTFETREAVARATDSLGTPLVWGTVQEFAAQVTVFWSAPPEGWSPVLLRDLYPPGSVGDVPTCADVGVLGALCLQTGSVMAIEAIKLLAGLGDPLLGRVLVIDALQARQREVPLASAAASVRDDAATAPARPAASAASPAPRHIDADALSALLASSARPDLLDVREAAELERGTIPGSRHVPLATLIADPSAAAEGRDPGAAPTVVICQVGLRARRAAEALLAAGVDALVLTGGMDAWSAREHEVIEEQTGGEA